MKQEPSAKLRKLLILRKNPINFPQISIADPAVFPADPVCSSSHSAIALKSQQRLGIRVAAGPLPPPLDVENASPCGVKGLADAGMATARPFPCQASATGSAAGIALSAAARTEAEI